MGATDLICDGFQRILVVALAVEAVAKRQYSSRPPRQPCSYSRALVHVERHHVICKEGRAISAVDLKWNFGVAT